MDKTATSGAAPSAPAQGGTLLSDLSRCRPAGAVSAKPPRGFAWQAVPYEAEGIAGTMLTAEPEWIVPDVELPLGAEGWHAIYLGLWKGGATVRLSGDAAGRHLRPDHDGANPVRFQEAFWKCADLTGQRLVFRHAPTLLHPIPKFGNCGASCVAWVRLVPLSQRQAKEWQSAAAPSPAKRLIGHDDFLTMQRKNGAFASEDSTRSQIEPYRNSDFEKLFLECWHGGGGVPAYRAAIAYAHEIGLQVYLARRMGSMPVEPLRRVRDRDGAELPRLSYAHPESQGQALEVLKQMASYRPDGVALFFHKGMPFVRYEEPVVQGFAENTGTDPFNLPEDAPEWLRWRAGFVTGFLRRAKRELAEYAAGQGMAPLRIAAYVLATRENNLFFGLDPETWIREGLVDEVVASYKFCPQAGERVDIYQINGAGPDFEYLAAAAEGTGCRVYCDLSPAGDTGRYAEPDTYRRLALDMYARGAHAPCIWDAHTRHPLPRQWNAIARLGHKDELAALGDGEGAAHRDVKVNAIGGNTVNRWG